MQRRDNKKIIRTKKYAENEKKKYYYCQNFSRMKIVTVNSVMMKKINFIL